MKITTPSTLLTLVFLWAFGVSAQVESAIELMNDTAKWQNYEPQMGGEQVDEEEDLILAPLNTRNLGLWTLNDSLANIPAYDVYCGFDTRNLFFNKSAREAIGDSAHFILCTTGCDFVFPCGGHQTSPFGPRWGRMHYGLDLDLETGDPVVAAFEGIVRIAQYSTTYGNVVVVRHNNGLETLYAHLSKLEVTPGDYVEAGALIGLGGNTGRSYGSHLHFEIRFLGEAIDPNIVIDPTHQKIRTWEITLTPNHFDHSDLVATNTHDTGSSRGKKYHTVKSGETLSSIARKRGTSVSNLSKLNKIKSTSTIRPGQKLRYK